MANDVEEPAGRPGFRPRHPGAILSRAISAANISKVRLAGHLGVSRQTVYQILNGERAVTADLAARLGRAFGNSPRFWLNLQAAHDTFAAEANPEVAKIGQMEEFASENQ